MSLRAPVHFIGGAGGIGRPLRASRRAARAVSSWDILSQFSSGLQSYLKKTRDLRLCPILELGHFVPTRARYRFFGMLSVFHSLPRKCFARKTICPMWAA